MFWVRSAVSPTSTLPRDFLTKKHLAVTVTKDIRDNQWYYEIPESVAKVIRSSIER